MYRHIIAMMVNTFRKKKLYPHLEMANIKLVGWGTPCMHFELAIQLEWNPSMCLIEFGNFSASHKLITIIVMLSSPLFSEKLNSALFDIFIILL